MQKRTIVATVFAGLATVSVAMAAVPKGAVRGRFHIGLLAKYDSSHLAQYQKGSNVFCVWSKDHVIVHVSVKNRSAAHVTDTIKPIYDIRRGGEHGSGLLSAKNYGFDAGEFRSLWIDAGKPEGIKAKTPISKCRPELYLIEAG